MTDIMSRIDAARGKVRSVTIMIFHMRYGTGSLLHAARKAEDM